jgi:murein L,D-transpeptidase YafK
MIRATVAGTLVLTAAFAAALTPVQCQTATPAAPPPLPAKATKELPSALLSLIKQKKIPKLSPVLVRIFKEEAELEVWKQDATGRFQLLKTYPICRWSGDIGPKEREGDRQTPEGFYTITPELMNPNSSYYLAINTGFPNAFDKANGRDGIYWLARDSFTGGRTSFQIQAYPFRMTPANLARHRTNPHMAFWQMIKVGYDHFETTHLEPKVDVCNRRYVFNAHAPPNSTSPFTFNPTGPCPAFVVSPKIAKAAAEKQRADEAEYARLIEEDTPVASIYTGLDGGMNDAFHARFPNKVISFARAFPAATQLPQLPPAQFVGDNGSLASKTFGAPF